MQIAANRDLKLEEIRIPQAEPLISRIGERARNLYQTRQMLCAEAVVTTLNQGLGGGLTDAQTVAMAAPFCAALGDSGCMCGALSGAVLAAGLIIGQEQPYRQRRTLRTDARRLHDAFRASNGATCCRVLSQKVKHDKNAHFRQCAGLTAEAAELAARLILYKRPELVERIDDRFLVKRQSKIGGALLRLLHHFSH